MWRIEENERESVWKIQRVSARDCQREVQYEVSERENQNLEI